MRQNRFFPQPSNYQGPSYQYQQSIHPNAYPAQQNTSQQHYPPPYSNMNYMQGPQYMQNMPNHQSSWQHPYPGMEPQKKSFSKGVMGYFQDENGQFDFDKALSTAGQVGNTYQQFSPLIKGIGSFFKGS